MIAGFELGDDAALHFDMPLQLAYPARCVRKNTFEHGPVHTDSKRREWFKFKTDWRREGFWSEPDSSEREREGPGDLSSRQIATFTQ